MAILDGLSKTFVVSFVVMDFCVDEAGELVSTKEDNRWLASNSNVDVLGEVCEEVERVDTVFCEYLILTSFAVVSIPVAITAVLVV